MKFLSLFLVFVFLISCTTSAQEKKNPIEGTWELVSGKWSTPDTTMLWPTTDSGRQIKMISRTHHVWIYQDTSQTDGYGFGAGKYTLDGDKYTEHIEFWGGAIQKNLIGKSLTFTMKVEGDKLIQSGIFPYKEFGVYEYDLDLLEVYKRLD
jgi:hypothetical protein